VIISIFGSGITSGSSGSSKWAPNGDKYQSLTERVCAYKYLEEKYLGRVQGKLNILKILKYFCVRNGFSIRNFAYFSFFCSSQTRINNNILGRTFFEYSLGSKIRKKNKNVSKKDQQSECMRIQESSDKKKVG